MKNYINFVQLIGHLGNDPELLPLESGTSLVKLNVATNVPYRDKKGDYQYKTTWHKVVAWGGMADHMGKSLIKGSHVLINGRLENYIWENNEGQKQTTTQIIATDYMLLNKKKSTEEVLETV